MNSRNPGGVTTGIKIAALILQFILMISASLLGFLFLSPIIHLLLNLLARAAGFDPTSEWLLVPIMVLSLASAAACGVIANRLLCPPAERGVFRFWGRL